MAFLQWLESTAFSTWLKESTSLLAYPAVLFLHTVGLIVTAGPSILISLRLLGFGNRLPVAPLDRFFPVIWIGFWVSVASGLVMLATDATTKLANPVFFVKMAFVAASAGFMVVVRALVKRDSAGDARSRWFAAASLVCWTGAIAAGRFMAFF